MRYTVIEGNDDIDTSVEIASFKRFADACFFVEQLEKVAKPCMYYTVIDDYNENFN